MEQTGIKHTDPQANAQGLTSDEYKELYEKLEKQEKELKSLRGMVFLSMKRKKESNNV